MSPRRPAIQAASRLLLVACLLGHSPASQAQAVDMSRLDPTEVPIGKLQSLVVDLVPTLLTLPWNHTLLKLTARISFRNPGPNALADLRIDYEARDAANLARPVFASFVFRYLAPNQQVSRDDGNMAVRVPAHQFHRVRYEAYAKVVGGVKLVPRSAPAKP